MLKNKVLHLIYIMLLLSALTACSKPVSHVVVTPEPPQSQFTARAEMHFKQGEALFMDGDIKGAEYHFDRVIDIFLDSGETSPDLKKQLDDYVSRISQIQLSYLKDRSIQDPDAHEAFLDEVVATPLFTPSPQEIYILKEKLHQEKPQYSVPVTINSQVVSFIKAFTNIRKQNIQNALNRSQEYIQQFKEIFKSYQVPEDLAYLPIIESGFRVNALSRARAMGVWQFMASTARLYGLRVDWVVDERRNPFKAAHAAAKLLKALHNEFGDWYLALACYNGGPRRIKRAIKRLKTKDFFKIARSRYIRRETRNYVPAFLASLIIAKNPETYGFTYEPTPSYFADTKIITVQSPISLKEAAELAGIPVQKLVEINPELIRDFTPFNKTEYSIRIPAHLDPAVLTKLRRLPAAKRYFTGWYKVRRGDSLYSIARKFNTSVKKLKQANKLRSNIIRPGKQLLIPRGG